MLSKMISESFQVRYSPHQTPLVKPYFSGNVFPRGHLRVQLNIRAKRQRPGCNLQYLSGCQSSPLLFITAWEHDSWIDWTILTRRELEREEYMVISDLFVLFVFLHLHWRQYYRKMFLKEGNPITKPDRPFWILKEAILFLDYSINSLSSKFLLVEFRIS